MNNLAKAASILALALTIGPPVCLLIEGLAGSESPAALLKTEPNKTGGPRGSDAAYRGASAGVMTEDQMKAAMAAGAVLWFLAAPIWLRENGK